MSKKTKRELTIWGTPKSPRTVLFANKVTPEFDSLMRKHATKEKCMITEMLEKYQAAYLREKEREKAQKEQKDQEKQQKENK